MSRIAVLHPDLGMRGGAEDVCLHTIEALQEAGHGVTLITLTRPDFETLNGHFDTTVEAPTVVIAGRLGPVLANHLENSLVRLQACLLYRAARTQLSTFDAVVSTKNEFAFEVPAVQYVHTSRFESADPGLRQDSISHAIYDLVTRRIADFERKRVAESTLLANSDWTGDLIEAVYGVPARTVYPPVSVTGLDPVPWEQRENGFLTVGRVGPSKRILKNIDVVRSLRERGHAVHLHVVGPTTDSAYYERVEAQANELPYVHVEGGVSYDRLLELFASHRYGLHGRPYEHFGIAVAELAAAGAIPFAPNSGGQREALGEDERLLYDDVDEAVVKIDTVLSSTETQGAVREKLEAVVSGFDSQRFKKNISAAVSQVLA